MLKHSLKLLNSNELKRLSVGQVSASTNLREKWDLITAVCLERKPVVTPPLTKLEKEYKSLLSQIEYEKSLKSDHEMRHEKEVKQLEQLKKGDDVDVHLKQTAQDFVDACVEELSQFKFGSKITDADSKNDLKSLNRKLDKHLVLVVNQKLGEENFYLLPQGLIQDGETLRQAADRVLKQSCGSSVKASIYGNAPSGFYKYKYPKDVRSNGSIGAKVFIYFARYHKGNLPTEGIEYKWLDRRELQQILPSKYQKSVLQMLIDE